LNERIGQFATVYRRLSSFDLSRWSIGRLTVCISHLRHLRQAIKPTHS
jgi:hypothetical protein